MSTPRAWPAPALRIPYPQPRKIVFAPDGQIVVSGPDRAWLAFNIRTKQVRSLPLRGTHAAFFGRWLLVRDCDQHHTVALEWRDDANPVECDIGFDVDYLHRQCAIAAATDSLAAIVRDGVLHIRSGSPDTIDNQEGWTSAGHISSNIRLLCSGDGRYVVGCNAGTTIDVVDTSSGDRKSIDVKADGHPFWAAIHPSEARVAVFSRNLVIADLERGTSDLVLRLPMKPTGEYLPDGALMFATEVGIMTWADDRLRLVSPPVSPFQEHQPLRVSPCGHFVVVPGEGDLAVYETSALREDA